MKNIGFIGLGVMGEAMAAQLVAAGYSLRVWNRTASKADRLLEQGAARAATPAEAAHGADAVVSMVADDAALREVSYGERGILAALPPGAAHLSMGTVSGEVTAELAAAHRAKGSELLAAPVFGSKEAARTSKLVCIATGPRALFDRCLPVLESMAQRAVYLGEDPAAAARMKVIVNMLISSAIAGMVQAFTAGSRLGVPAETLMEVIRLVFISPVYERYGSRLVSRDFSVHFPLKLMLKDVSLMLAMGAAAGVPLPHAALVREMVIAAVGQGYGDLDAAGGLLQSWEKASGLCG